MRWLDEGSGVPAPTLNIWRAPESWQRAFRSPLTSGRNVALGTGVELQLSSTGKPTWLCWLEDFLFCSFTLKIAAHMLVATSLSPRSSLEEWDLAGWVKI